MYAKLVVYGVLFPATGSVGAGDLVNGSWDWCGCIYSTCIAVAWASRPADAPASAQDTLRRPLMASAPPTKCFYAKKGTVLVPTLCRHHILSNHLVGTALIAPARTTFTRDFCHQSPSSRNPCILTGWRKTASISMVHVRRNKGRMLFCGTLPRLITLAMPVQRETKFSRRITDESDRL